MQLKHETTSDTDIAVIRARDLKYVAENWQKHAKKNTFTPMLFNATGILERADLETWMKVVL